VRLRHVEKYLAALETSRVPVAPPRAAPPPAEPPAAAPVEPAPPPAPATRRIDIESIIAGRWLNRVGIVALLLAVGFFLKNTFDSDWIGPAGRVAIGLLFGAVLLVYSQLLIRRGYLYFSEGIAGTGVGVLYLSLYAAWGFYDLIPQAVAFTGMVVVTLLSGGLVAGLNGGMIYNSFPLMGGQLVPSDYGFFQPWISNHLENPATAQFNHRVLAVATVVAALGLWMWHGRQLLPVAAMAVLQLGLGIATLLLVVPVWLGALHQAGALMLFTLALWALYRLPGRGWSRRRW